MTAIRTIGVGYDGSPGAEAAVRWALGLAEQVGGDVVVVHAVGMLEHLSATDQPQHGGALEADVRRIAAEVGVPEGSVRVLLLDGDPCSVLTRAAAPPIGADLLVVGSRGRGAHAGRLLGSTSHEVAEHSPVPVVIVPTERPAPSDFHAERAGAG